MEIFEFKHEPEKETIEDFLTYVKFRFPNQDIEIFFGGARVKILKKNANPPKREDNNAGWDDTNSENQTAKPKYVETNKFVVARLDIYNAPGLFDLQTYDNERDALIYCDMMNTDTNMIHRVFISE